MQELYRRRHSYVTYSSIPSVQPFSNITWTSMYVPRCVVATGSHVDVFLSQTQGLVSSVAHRKVTFMR